MAIMKQKVNLLGMLTQYHKVVDGDKTNKDGSQRMKNTAEIKGYHVFYTTEIKKWNTETPHQTISIADFDCQRFLEKKKYLDEIYIVVDVEDINSVPKFVQFEEIKQ